MGHFVPCRYWEGIKRVSTPDPRPQAETDDKALVLSFQTGERSGAYREIYERYEPRVQSVCKRMLACPEDAEEACQETFLRVYLSLGRFNGRYQLSAWMSRIATNVCLDMIRTKKRRPSEPRDIEDLEHEAAIPETEGDPEWSLLRKTNADSVRSILDSLPTMHRKAILLRDYDGLSYVDIASRLSITEKQTKALLHRARKNFRRTWTGGSIASLLLPERILSKLRKLPRLDEATTRSPNVISDVVGSMGNFATSCSTVVQQCGQIAVERFAGTAMAIVVGTAAVGAPVIAHTATQQHREDERRTSEAGSADIALITTPGEEVSPLRNRKALTPPEEPPAEEPQAAPAPAPEPAPEPAPTPTQSPPAGGGETGGTQPPPPTGDGTGKPKDTSSPPPVDPSTPPTVAAWFASATAPVATSPLSYSASVNCTSLVIEQEFPTTVADRDGRHPAYLVVRTGPNPTLSMTVAKKDQEIVYNGGASSQIWKRTGDAIELSFSGSYGLIGNGNPESVNLPKSGRFDVRLMLDCAAPRVVTEDITFHL